LQKQGGSAGGRYRKRAAVVGGRYEKRAAVTGGRHRNNPLGQDEDAPTFFPQFPPIFCC
jgi:hypothetical protein